jgi:hypothetical protein
MEDPGRHCTLHQMVDERGGQQGGDEAREAPIGAGIQDDGGDEM